MNPNKNGEYALIKKLLQLSKNKFIFFDVGGNKATHTLQFHKLAKQLNKEVKSYTFEPFPSAFEIIKKSIIENCIEKRCTLVNKAISNTTDKSIFYYDSKEKASGQNSLIKHYMLDSSMIVETITLDRFFKDNKLERINFLKIDIEGFEINAISGAKNIMNKGLVDYIQLEYNQTWIETGGSIKKLMKIIDEKYSLFILRKNSLLSIDSYHFIIDDFYFCNLLLIKKGCDIPFKISRKAIKFI